ncbi:MAG: ATP-binding protein [Oscillospiraceae bacterium]|nr:ATP-binding protein [Oscillospiraceae bacterium]
MTKKIFRSTMLVAAAVLAACLLLIFGFLCDYFEKAQETQLRGALSLAAAGVGQGGADYLAGVGDGGCRVTWVAADGTVLGDTQADAAGMENHADREEIREALAEGTGSSVRYSKTLLRQTVYLAQRLGDGTVVRVSVSRITAGALLLSAMPMLCAIFIASLALSAALANSVSKRIVGPLNDIDLENPLESGAYEELAPLLGRIRLQHAQIDRQLRELRRKQEEFEQITGSLNEGLVLLDDKGTVLSINPAARRIFDTGRPCAGEDFVAVDRSRELRLALEAAMENGRSELRAQRGGREYQFNISRIAPQDAPAGAVILAFDVTEQASAERSRREFTANVSHELKTPLQSIIGSAELLGNGMVSPQDAPRFVDRIREEAARLVTLIDDIIRLSQLDEGAPMPRERVDLLAAAQEAADGLQSAAAAKNVRLRVGGDPVAVTGVRRLLLEMIANLCDNAIKYNKQGGTVDVTVGAQGADAAVTVKDTGIGIPPAFQDKVFERFYRVDKSRSKASGGTGLGLSIVKHVVQCHGGRIELDSRPGEGTQIRVLLPGRL